MTRLAKELAVPDVVVGAVQHLVAHGALEAALVPLEAPGQPLLRGVHRLAAHRALGHLHRLERHPDQNPSTSRQIIS